MSALRELERDAREHVDELIAVRRRLATEERSTQAHSALVAAVAQAQRTWTALEKLRQRAHGGYSRSGDSVTANACEAAPPALLATLERHRVLLRRELPRAAAVLERWQLSTQLHGHAGKDGVYRTASSGGYDYNGSADAADALRSLVRTRKLLSLELNKVDTAMSGLTKSTAVLDTLRTNLHDVQDGMARARRVVRVLMTIKSRDDAMLRAAVLLFVCTVVYVLLHRILRLFPHSVYVDLA